jgi:hypothetical protein
MAVSEAAVGGVEGPRTFKLQGVIQELEILILLDSGSSHSFLSSWVASQLKGVTAISHPLQVKVANGNLLQASTELRQATWSVQGYQFQSDLKMLDLQNFDMVLGMDWLDMHSLVKIHWTQKWMKIPYFNTQNTLHGIQPGVIDCNLIKLWQLSEEVSTDMEEPYPPVVQHLLSQF